MGLSMVKDRKHVAISAAVCLGLFLAVLMTVALARADWSFTNLWSTPNQQAQKLFDRGEYLEAAERYTDEFHRGHALYLAKDFEAAADAFGRAPGPQAAYNRGNSLVILGRYEDAIKSYDVALEYEPDWKEAQDNRELAILRRDRLAETPNEGEGTGGQLGADEIVFDDRAQNSSDETTVEVSNGEQMGDDEFRALWLRTVDTKPSAFLRAKFSYQLSRDRSGAGDE